jgi:acetylornithine deacetylase/succinyl-diaminopimelate desuccinylase-like protein
MMTSGSRISSQPIAPPAPLVNPQHCFVPTIHQAVRLIGSITLIIAPHRLQAQTAIDTAKLQDEAVARTQDYIRINTTNPPGNEALTMKFLAGILQKEGIAFDTASSAPGRGNLWARLKGGAKPALVLLHHMDVVPAEPKYWDGDPFAGTVTNGVMFGRGTLDTKTLGILELEAFLALHRAHVALDRDVIFMATADEEAGGNFGAGWVVVHHPESFRGAGLLFNEGGDCVLNGEQKRCGVEVTQKTPFWLKLTATGKPGHGSTPSPASAVNRLIRALYRLQTYEFAPRVVPAVATYLAAIAPAQAPRWRDPFLHPATIIADRNTLTELQIDLPEIAALLRNTCSITRLEGSPKINVIPPEAQAQVDCRLLPDQDHDAFQRELQSAINDPEIKVERLLDFTPAVSPTTTVLYSAIADVIHRHFPDASIAPSVETGFTDSHWFRDLGIACYGFAPFLIPEAEESGVHGNNERISVDNIRRGTQMMLEIVNQVVSEP